VALKQISIKLPEDMLFMLERVWRRNGYISRSEFIRVAIRDLLRRVFELMGGREKLGTIDEETAMRIRRVIQHDCPDTF